MTTTFKIILLEEKANLGEVIVDPISRDITICLDSDKEADYKPLFETVISTLVKKEGLYCACEGLVIKNPPELFLTALAQTLLLNLGILIQKEN